MTISSTFDKISYTRHLLQTIEHHKPSHEVFFVTMNFMKNSSKNSADFFFERMMLKLNNILIPNGRQSHSYPSLMMFPEISHNRHLHYHGFLLIHKNNIQKFNEKAVARLEPEHIASLDQSKDHHVLNQNLISPYTPEVEKRYELGPIGGNWAFDGFELLKVQSHRVFKLENDDELPRAFNYTIKNFETSSFSEKDVIVKCRHAEDRLLH